MIVLDRGGTEVLLVPNGARHILPWVEIPRCQRVVENLTVALKSEWGEEVACLFEPTTELPADGGVAGYQASEHLRSCGSPKMPTHWVPLLTLRQGSLLETRDYAAIMQVAGVCNREIQGAFAGPFARLGWFSEVRNWIEAVIEPMGFHVNGEFRQLNATPSFSLVRFETSGPALWFKAVGEPNQREFAITCLLSRAFPSHLAPVLATRPEWNGWLAREAEGELLSSAQERRTWYRVAAELAELQISSLDQSADILAAGARDLRVKILSKQIQHFMDVTQQLMQQQRKKSPPVLEPKDVRLLGDRIGAAFDVIQKVNLPDTLGHLDFNPGNVVVSSKSCVFLDWAEAYVGNPFLTFQYLLEYFRRTYGKDSNEESQFVESYVAPWLRILSPEAVDVGLAVSPVLAVFSYACGTGMFSDVERLKDADFAGYLRSLARRMDREARVWADRSSKCTTPAIA